MSEFLFEIAEREIYRGLLDLGSGTFYLYLLSAAPDPEVETVAELKLALPTPVILTGLVYQPDLLWKFDNPIFPNPINLTIPAVGTVICKRSGASPSVTDRTVCFSPITIPIGSHSLEYSFPSTGVLKFGTLPIGIVDLQFNEPNGSTNLIDRANHKFKQFGTPVIAEDGSAVFDGGGMLIATNILDRTTESNKYPLIAVAAVGNNNFANATVLAGRKISSTGNIIYTTSELNYTHYGRFQGYTLNSLWWSWTAPTTESYIIDTNGSEVIDTTLVVLTGDSLPALSVVKFNDNVYSSSGTDYLHSRISLNAVKGVTYHIAVDGKLTKAGGIVFNINPNTTTEWEFDNNNGPQDLTFSIKFKLNNIGVTYNGSQYLFDSRNEDYATDVHASRLAIRYDYDSTKPAKSYLAFELYEFQADLKMYGPERYYIPFIPVADTSHRLDVVLLTDDYGALRPQIYIDGCYYGDSLDWLEWRLDKFAIGGTLHTNDTYPNIGDYPGYFNGSIDFIKIIPHVINPVTSFAHPLTRVLDLPFKSDFNDIAPWDCQVIPHGNVSLDQNSGVNFGGGYLELKANKTTYPDDYDWQITLEIIVPPNPVQDTIIFARLPDEKDSIYLGDFFGVDMCLAVNPKFDDKDPYNYNYLDKQEDLTGKLYLTASINVQKNKYDTRISGKLRSVDRIDDGLPHKITIVRTNGCKDHAHTTAIAGQPPRYVIYSDGRSSSGYNMLTLYVDDIYQNQTFGPNELSAREKSSFNNQPIYLGGLPPEITPADPNKLTNNRFLGSIKYFNFDNHLPDVPKLVEFEFDERDGCTTPLDLAAHTYTNIGAVTINNKKAVFNGSNHLIASPIGNEWNIDDTIEDQQYTFSVEWQFDSLANSSPYQYIFDSRTINGTTDIISLAYHHNAVEASSYLEVSINNYEADILIPLHAVVNTQYRIDILLWKAKGQINSCVFLNGAYYQQNLLSGSTYNWAIDRMLVGGCLSVNSSYPNPGDYLWRLQGKINRIKWVYGAFNPITAYARSLNTVLDLEFEDNYLDSSEYNHDVTSFGNISIANRRAVFEDTNGGGGLSIAASNVFDFSTDWRLDIETDNNDYGIHVDVPIICRPEIGTDDGGGFILTYTDLDYPGYLVFRDKFSLSTTQLNECSTGAGSGVGTRPPLLKSKNSQTLIAHSKKISIIRTSGILNHNTYNAIWMFINGVFQDVSFTAQRFSSPNTPVYIGSVPPGCTTVNGNYRGNGSLKGNINYVRFQNSSSTQPSTYTIEGLVNDNIVPIEGNVNGTVFPIG